MTETAERFQAARVHPEAARLLAHVPDSEAEPKLSGLLSSAAAVAFFVLVGLLLSVGLAAAFPPLAIVPIAVVAVGLGFYGFTVYGEWKRQRTPLERHLALIVDEEVRMHEGAAHTTHIITLEYGDGSRAVLHAIGEFMEGARPGVIDGAIGVAYQRADALVQFERLPV